MWGKFFAFAMLVLILLVIIQFSTMSDQDVEKIKAQIELQQMAKESQSEIQTRTTPAQSPSDDSASVHSFRSEPAIVAYETFLDAAPSIQQLSDIDQYYVASVLDEYKKRLINLSAEPLEGFKGMHDLQGMEYMATQNIGEELVIATFIATNRFTRAVAADEVEALAVCRVLMKKENGQWLIQDEAWVPQAHPAFTPYEPLLAEYHRKRQGK